MSKQVEPTEKSPIDVTDTFTADVPVVYCTAKLSRAPAGTVIKAEFFYLEGGEQKIAEFEMPNVEGTRYVSFKLNPPPTGWPLGQYKTVVHLDGKPRGETSFTVVEVGGAPTAAATKVLAPVPARTTPASAVYRTFSSTEHGFTLKYPGNWVEGAKSSPAVAFIYLANLQNDPVSNINVQVIPVTLEDPSQSKEAVNLVAQQLIDQITSEEGSSIKNDEWVQVGPNNGRELVFEYPFKDKSLRQRQFLTFHGLNVYAVIYTAENAVYDQFLPQYEKAVETLTFFEK